MSGTREAVLERLVVALVAPGEPLPPPPPGSCYVREVHGDATTHGNNPRMLHYDPACRYLHYPRGRAVLVSDELEDVVHCRRPT